MDESGEEAATVALVGGELTGGDDRTLRDALGEAVDVVGVASAAELFARAGVDGVDCAVVDGGAGADDGDGVSAVESLRDRDPALPCIVVGDDPRAEAAPAALAAGAADYVERGATAVLAARVEREVERERTVAEWREASGMLDSMLDSMLTNLPVTVYFKDEEARFVRVTENLRRWYPDVIGSTDRDLWPADSEETYADDRRVIDDGEEIVGREESKADGSTLLTTKVPWRNGAGDIVGLIGVSREITERKRYERQLAQQNERLEQFVGIVSHDLRTPLNLASGYTRMARETDDVDDLATVEDALDRMDRLVDDLLTMARHGKTVTETRSVDLRAVAEESWTAVDPGAATLDLAFDGVTVDADRDRFRRLLDNLFGNVDAHAGDGVTVTVSAGRRTIRVEDDGRGIPPDRREEVFEYVVTHADDGTGFGLSIVRDIADAHGWTVEVGESDDGGARFDIRSVTTTGTGS